MPTLPEILAAFNGNIKCLEAIVLKQKFEEADKHKLMDIGLASHILENAKALNLLKDSDLTFPMYAVYRCIFESCFKLAYLLGDDEKNFNRHKEFENESIIEENKQIKQLQQSTLEDEHPNKLIEKNTPLHYKNKVSNDHMNNHATIGFTHEPGKYEPLKLPSMESMVRLAIENNIKLFNTYYAVYYRESSAQNHARFSTLCDYLKKSSQMPNESNRSENLKSFLDSANDLIFNINNALYIKYQP